MSHTLLCAFFVLGFVLCVKCVVFCVYGRACFVAVCDGVCILSVLCNVLHAVIVCFRL